MKVTFPPLKKSLLQMLGPSVIFVALSISGGEMLLWPNLASNYGLKILWPILLILLLQFIVNIEIERYTLVTGKSVESSLVGTARWLSIVFSVTVLVSLVWPAWMTTSGNLIALLAGFQGNAMRDAGLVGGILLLLSTVILFRRKETYRALETCSKYSLMLVIAIIAFVLILKFDGQKFIEGLKGLFAFGYLPEGMPRFDFVAALAYGGVAGILNLVQSEWIKDKGYGVNSLTPKQIERVDLTQPESQKNYRRWFSMIQKEHFILFVLANIFTIFVLSYLGAILLPIGSAQGFQVLVVEIEILNQYVPFLGSLFAIAGIVVFFMANVTILDATGRLIFRMIKPTHPKLTAKKISEIAAYVGVAILLSSIFIPSFKQPFLLLVISASLSAFTMWLYAPLLLKLNSTLPAIARPSLLRSILVLVAAAFYGIVTLWALSAYIPLWIVIGIAVLITGYHLFVLTRQIAR